MGATFQDPHKSSATQAVEPVFDQIPVTIGALFETLDQLSLGAAVVNKQGHSVAINSLGRRLLDRIGVAGAANEAEWFRQAISRLNEARSPSDETLFRLREHFHDDLQLAVRVAPMGRGYRDWMILLLVDLRTVSLPDAGSLRRIYGLTAAEAALAVSIGRGQTLGQIARGRGVTVATLRSQLAVVFAKTGARRQTELALRLNRFSVPP